MLKTEVSCEAMGNLTINESSVDPAFVRLAESFGYDVELRLVARGNTSEAKGGARYHKQYLYRMTFPNGMVYIGTAWDIASRWANRGSQYRGQRVWDAIQEFGWENIKREILLYIPYNGKRDDLIREEERRLIRAYADRCYNRQCTESFHKEVAQTNRDRGNCAPKHYWEIGGVTKPAMVWCEERGVTYTRMKRIIDRYGLSPEQALALPPVPLNMTRRAVEFWESQGFKIKEA